MQPSNNDNKTAKVVIFWTKWKWGSHKLKVWNVANVVLRGKFKVLNACIKKRRKILEQWSRFHLK